MRLNTWMLKFFVSVGFFAGASLLFAAELKAPPRSIDDVLQAIKKNTKESESLSEAKKLILKKLSDQASDEEKNHFYFNRAEAYFRVGQTDKAIADLILVTEKYPSSNPKYRAQDLQILSSYQESAGNLKDSLATSLKQRAAIPPNAVPMFLANDTALVTLYSETGNFVEAEKYLRDAEATLVFARRSPNYIFLGDWWNAEFIHTKGIYLIQQGKWAEAEAILQKGVPLIHKWFKKVEDLPINKLGFEAGNDEDATTKLIRHVLPKRLDMQRLYANALANQGKLIEAEIQIREALQLALSYYGADSQPVADSLIELSGVIAGQSRMGEAIQLAQLAVQTYLTSGSAENSNSLIKTKRAIGRYLVMAGQFEKASKVFDEVNALMNSNKMIGDQGVFVDIDWAIAKVKINQAESARKITQELIANLKKQSNPSERLLAEYEIMDAYALHGMGQDEQAQTIYSKYMPTLLSFSEGDSENGNSSEYQRKILALEDEISILAGLTKSKPEHAPEYMAQAFKLADVVRGSGVQRALTASAARANIKAPKLANLARQEQDTQARIASLEKILGALLAAPADDQLPAVQAQMRKDIAQLKVERTQLKKEIELQFPDYANLVNPKPVTLESIKKLLKPEEVFVSWYFSDKESFVWTVTAHDAPQFHKLNTTRQQVAQTVTQLRRALDPNVSSVAELPRFDVALANRLYQDILAPIESALVGKKVMLTVPHGELGQLPLSLLVTQNTPLDIKSKNTDFSDYRQVPWLMKNIAIAQLPSATALVSLRNAPKHNHVRRAFAGFGDPYFSDKQAEQAQTQVSMATTGTSRGAGFSQRSTPKTRGVNSAQLALLPRLPDTQDEIEQIAHALGADPAKDIFLHKQANVSKVLSTDLSDRQVVMFATHGLVPGDLDGLTQPALALTAPSVSGETEGDGLLTMDKILSMKLNADWVILSACNTALGEGAGAEAVSGLGRAFFYAGARALLVTNWPVDSQSATLLTSEMFHFFKEKPNLSKPEYLQMTMRNMLDNLGLQDSTGKTLYTYAHPLFWAPYVLVGD